MNFSLILLILIPISVPIFDFLTWLFISVFFYKVNPFVSEKGRVGTYLTIKQYSNSNKMIGSLDISFDELFGITGNATLQFEKESLLKQIKEKDKEIKKLKEAAQ